MAITDKHYHPAVAQRLRQFIVMRDWQAMATYMDGLSNSLFRTAGYMLGETFLMQLPEDDCWEMCHVLIPHNPRALLVTLMKTIANRLHEGSLTLTHQGLKSLANAISSNTIDCQKALLHLLPGARDPQEVQYLFDIFSVADAEARLPFLLRIPTLPCSYMLLKVLKFMEHDRATILRTVYFLIKRGDSLSFNLASLLKAYFDLDEVKGTFSLCIKPYEMARLEESYPAFVKAMEF